MDDHKKKTIDSKLISLVEPHEREYWSGRLMASVENLQDAIDATGSHSVEDIRNYLIVNDL